MKNCTRIRSRVQIGLAGALITSLLAFAPSASAGGDSEGKVTVVHAVPDLTVDVYANDALLLEDFAPGTIVGPVKLPSGTYELKITPADSETVALSGSATLADGDDVSVVAHLTEEGDPALAIFGNKMRPIGDGRTRITVRHVAAAPEVDIRIRRSHEKWAVAIEDFANGQEATTHLRPGAARFDALVRTPQRVPLAQRT
jgi:Domain of unknown function (DUF4397)